VHRIMVQKKEDKIKNIAFFYFYIISLALLGNGCKDKDAEAVFNKPTDYHYLVVGKQLYEEEGCLRAKDEPLNYRITVSINDNPICSINEPTGIFAINHYIKSGENRVKICTEGLQSIEAAVTATSDFMSQSVKGHVQYDPQESSSLECEFTFLANINYTLPIYRPENYFIADEQEKKANVLKLIKSVLDAFDRGKMEKAASILFEGSQLYSPCAFGISSKDTRDAVEAHGMKNPIFSGSGSIQYQKFEPEKYAIKYGKNIILVYRKDGKNVFYKSILSETPTTVAYIDGKYIVWFALN